MVESKRKPEEERAKGLCGLPRCRARAGLVGSEGARLERAKGLVAS